MNKYVLLAVPNTEGSFVVPLMVLAGVVLVAFRNCWFVTSRMWRRFLLLVAAVITVAAVAVLFKYFAVPYELLATFLSIAGYLTAFVYNAVFYWGGHKRWRSMYTVFWFMYDYLLGLAILYPLYLLSFVGLVSDLHTWVLYNASFSKGLQVPAMPCLLQSSHPSPNGDL